MAVLEIAVDDRTLVFELAGDLSDTEEVERSFPGGGRGQLLREAIGWIPGTGDIDRRKGYYVDVGTGSHTWRLQIPTAGYGDDQWGDNSSAPGEINRYDATGEDVHPYAKKQVLAHWLGQSRSDSFGNTTLHVGQYSDGTHGDDGVFDPIRAGIQNATVGFDAESEPAAIDVTLEISWAATAPSSADPGDIDTDILTL